ncbi:hypothetical protein MED297_15360 [Reinekea sp. MED297]|uniref:AlgX/AlgJ SGNH hydrolase-like domain-containing protein n=1 Tax=Reinekea blandensis MED297 TaxID=314283 RepID=A4BIY7_9GAMM|nr:hypothetical protein MED297_15360 [Reinekea sp. MED297] [Reinekea blandensis MED297]
MISFTAAFLIANYQKLPNGFDAKDSSREMLSVDLIEAIRNFGFLKLGVSGNPEKVLVGRDSFLFLGESHNRSLTQYLNRQTINFDATAKGFDFLESLRRDRGYEVVFQLAPSKASIYSSKLPHFLGNVIPFDANDDVIERYRFAISPKNRLLSQVQGGFDVYFKGDTHWNEFGAYISYLQVMEQLEILNDESYEYVNDAVYENIQDSTFRDLERFLKLDKIMLDKQTLLPGDLSSVVNINDSFGAKINVEQLDYRIGGKTVMQFELPNKDIGSNHNPYHIENETALNSKSVLWLRDSFGTAMSKPIFYTFSNVTLIHPNRLTQAEFDHLIKGKTFDIVLVTLTERQAYPLLEKLPNLMANLPEKSGQSSACKFNLRKLSLWDYEIYRKRILMPETTGLYEAIGKDPQIGFDLRQINESLCAKKSLRLSINVKSKDVLQIYYRAESMNKLTEAMSVKFNLQPGLNVIEWLVPDGVSEIRVDPIQGVGHFVFDSAYLELN